MKNILGTDLEICGCRPITGYLRDGFCRTNQYDQGRHLVCAVITDEFLRFTASMGNDLVTPRPEFDFPGLVAGDHWCLCVLRWLEAERAGAAPPIIAAACHSSILQYVDIAVLSSYFVAEDDAEHAD